MKAEAKKHIEKRFFDGYPQHELDYIGDHRLKDIAELMEEYANHKALAIIKQAVGEERNRGIHIDGVDLHGSVLDNILKTVRRKLMEDE